MQPIKLGTALLGDPRVSSNVNYTGESAVSVASHLPAHVRDSIAGKMS